jgi:hypothetical protein
LSLLGSIFGSRTEFNDIRDEMAELKRAVKSLQAEWDDYYDKTTKILRRIGRERQNLDSMRESTQEEPVEPQVAPSQGDGTHGFLTARQRLIQQQILQRRVRAQ